MNKVFSIRVILIKRKKSKQRLLIDWNAYCFVNMKVQTKVNNSKIFRGMKTKITVS